MNRINVRKKMEQDGIQNAGISAKERLSKIEEKLDNILGKLDNKADRSDFIELERRVREIEMHGTTQIQDAVTQMRDIREEFTKQTAELTKGQGKLRANVAYIMGAAAAIIIIVDLVLRK